MIQSFGDKDTEEFFYTERNRKFPAVARVALRKLIQMNQARVLVPTNSSPRYMFTSLTPRARPQNNSANLRH